MIDINEVLNAPQGQLESRRETIPAGTEAVANITKIDMQTGTSTGADGSPREWAALDVVWRLTEGDFVDRVITQRVFLNFSEDGQLDAKNNQSLGKLQDAMGLEEGWTIQQLEGRSARIILGVGAKKEDPEDKYNYIKRVQAL